MTILNNITTNTIIIAFLSLIVIIAIYTEYIKPMIINFINGKSINDTITEAFTSQYSSCFRFQSVQHIWFKDSYNA